MLANPYTPQASAAGRARPRRGPLLAAGVVLVAAIAGAIVLTQVDGERREASVPVPVPDPAPVPDPEPAPEPVPEPPPAPTAEERRLAEQFRDQGIEAYARRDFDATIDNATRAIELTPDDEHLYRLRGIARRYRGDTEGSFEDLTRAIELTATELSPEQIDQVMELRSRLRLVNGVSLTLEPR